MVPNQQPDSNAPTDRTDYRITTTVGVRCSPILQLGSAWGLSQDDLHRVASNEPPFFGINIEFKWFAQFEHVYLVGGIPTPLKNMKVNGKDYHIYGK